jgi:hypothetical protein
MWSIKFAAKRRSRMIGSGFSGQLSNCTAVVYRGALLQDQTRPTTPSVKSFFAKALKRAIIGCVIGFCGMVALIVFLVGLPHPQGRRAL